MLLLVTISCIPPGRLCPPKFSVLKSALASRLGRRRIRIVPAMVPVSVPVILTLSVEPNELTALACCAARAIAWRGDSGLAAWDAGLELPHPAASTAAAAVMAITQARERRAGAAG